MQPGANGDGSLARHSVRCAVGQMDCTAVPPPPREVELGGDNNKWNNKCLFLDLLWIFGSYGNLDSFPCHLSTHDVYELTSADAGLRKDVHPSKINTGREYLQILRGRSTAHSVEAGCAAAFSMSTVFCIPALPSSLSTVTSKNCSLVVGN